jgi:hypothetical protein
MALRRQAKAGALASSEVFFFTNNSTAELAIHGGSATSPKLHELLIKLKVVQAQYEFRLLVCHCAGTRMIAQGTDGVSRGQLNKGVMGGTDMMSFIPLHLDATSCSSSIEPWIRSWLGPWLPRIGLNGATISQRGNRSRLVLAPKSLGRKVHLDSSSGSGSPCSGGAEKSSPQTTGLYACIHLPSAYDAVVAKTALQGLRLGLRCSCWPFCLARQCVRTPSNRPRLPFSQARPLADPRHP